VSDGVFQERTVHRVIPILLLVAVVGCSKGSPGEEGTSTTAAPTSAATGAAPSPTSSPANAPASAPAVKPVPAEIPAIVARVNGEDISKVDFESAVSNLEARANSPVPPTERDRVYRNVLDELIGYKLLLQESRARKVAVTEADVDARMSAVQKQFPSEDAFKKMLASR
jgi:hypothetical protein